MNDLTPSPVAPPEKVAICNSGPTRLTCSSTYDKSFGQMQFTLSCDLLAPHNGDHHDRELGLYWRPDLVRYEMEQWA